MTDYSQMDSFDARSQMNSQPKLVVGVTIGSSAYSFLRGQLSWFANNGWNPVLVSSPDRMARAASERENVPLRGIKMERGISPVKDAAALYKWIVLLKNEKAEAVSVGTPKASFLGMIAAAILQVPRRLYVVRGLRLEGTSRPLVWVLWFMEWLTMRLATDVFFVSDSLAKECRKRSLYFPHKSWLIGAGSSNGVDAHAIEEVIDGVQGNILRSTLGFSKEDFVVGFVGRINKDKGFGEILDALQSSRIDHSVKVLALGDLEDDSFGTSLAQFGDRLITTGWKDDVWRYIPAMDVLCLPTRREGFPNVVLEAAVAGVPTITTFATGAVDSVVDGETGLLVPFGNSEALVDGINKLARNPVFIENLGKAARQRAIDDFKPVRIWKGLDEILRGKKIRTESRLM